MPRAARVVLAILVGTLLAGCVAPVPAADVPPSGPVAARLAYEGCEGFEVFTPVPAERVAHLLPPMYSFEGPTAFLVSESGGCDLVRRDDAALGMTPNVGFVVLQVVPPPEHEGEGIDLHVLLLAWMAGTQEELDTFAAWGVSVGELSSARLAFPLGDAPGPGNAVAEGANTTVRAEGALGAVTMSDGYLVRFHDATGRPVFDAAVPPSRVREGPGTHALQGAPIEGTFAGGAVHRVPGFSVTLERVGQG